MKAILFDGVRCIGCRACEKACDEHNAKFKRKWSEKEYGDFRKPPEGLSGDKWLHMSTEELPLPEGVKREKFDMEKAGDGEYEDSDQFRFTRHSCMHCVHPGCVSACIVGALQKTPEGPVIYDQSMCIGCRYCMLACPFEIPKWEWHKALPYIRKCTMCVDKKDDKGDWTPSCVEACPADALAFGERDDLAYEAEKRTHEDTDAYYPHVFGRDELGGTSLLYVWDNRLAVGDLGLPIGLGTRPIPDFAASPMSTVPYWVGGLGAMFGGLYWIINRRNTVPAEERTEREGGAQ